MFIAKKRIPGPSVYNNEGLKPKIVGFYGNSESKCSVIGSTAYEKKFVPGPNAYESRGKSMSDLLKEKAKNYMYNPENDIKKSKMQNKFKKTNEPAPTSYKVAESMENCAKMRVSIKNTIPKAKNASYISKLPRRNRCSLLVVVLSRHLAAHEEAHPGRRQLQDTRDLQAVGHASNESQDTQALKQPWRAL